MLKQEIKRLELLLKESDIMFHEKEHIKTNLLKFLETAGSKSENNMNLLLKSFNLLRKYLESEEYLKVLFSMLDVTEMEKESVLQIIGSKNGSKNDKKRGFVSILFKH